ncbi:magnesium transporter CorA family protein [Lacticaseibacillus pabuli]|uniref:Magnesium transporter CorA family protein n=1 Tax=Lacticaseibacillus pabuli TaxID=3025672 RepID=A0ABY7WSD5_9LACO|nr:magnesium transporter CorA family protein [Lacticaseibacillus sp. KACC 23028]WDF83041.1 magnesium transporter CorA family protein [Lacticaseibacillus sp. KACC 23028]
MLTYYHINNGTATPSSRGDSQWLALTNPDVDELKDLAEQYGLSPRVLTGLLDEHEDPRSEGLDPDDNVPGLIVLRYPVAYMNQMKIREFQTMPLSLILLDDRVITISSQPLPTQLQTNLMSGHWLTGVPEETALHILWCVLHAYVKVVEVVNAQVTAMSRELGKASRNEQLYQIMALQKSLIYLESVLDNTTPLLKDLRAGERYFTKTDYDDALRDVMTESHQAQTMTSVAERILEQFNTTVSSIVSNNLNIIMKVLTSITIILTIPTVIGGLWGMNVPVPFAHQYWAFWGICAATTVLCGICAYVLWKHDYF